jgi:hypothetical protein
MIKAWLDNIMWVDENGEIIEDENLPASAFIEFKDTDDMDEFAEAVDELLSSRYGASAVGWSWELITKETLN